MKSRLLDRTHERPDTGCHDLRRGIACASSLRARLVAGRRVRRSGPQRTAESVRPLRVSTQAAQDLNLEPPVLETGALPIAPATLGQDKPAAPHGKPALIVLPAAWILQRNRQQEV